MGTLIYTIRNLSLILTLAAMVPVCSCTRMSKQIRDKTTGMNIRLCLEKYTGSVSGSKIVKVNSFLELVA